MRGLTPALFLWVVVNDEGAMMGEEVLFEVVGEVISVVLVMFSVRVFWRIWR